MTYSYKIYFEMMSCCLNEIYKTKQIWKVTFLDEMKLTQKILHNINHLSAPCLSKDTTPCVEERVGAHKGE